MCVTISERGILLMASNETALGLRARARLGTTLRGKYRLESVLGIGGMAVVYRAQHRNRAEFAVKMLLPELALDEEVRKRFLREGYVANSVKHSGVVRVVDDDATEDGSAFLVMELLDGMSADELFERRGNRLPPQIALTIGYHLLDVLVAAHAAGVVHRDIKPANVFVTRDGLVKVLDFGIARVRDAASLGASATQTGVTFGTPAFMAPEQAQGKTREVDERSDIWAAAATMFMLMTGSLVHTGENATMIMVSAATQPPRSLSELLPNIAPSIAEVIDAGLRFRKEDRWQTAAQMRDALLAAYVTRFGEPPSQVAMAAYCQSTPVPQKIEDSQVAKLPPRDDDNATTAERTSPNATAKPVWSDSDKRGARRSRNYLFIVAAMVSVVAGLGTLLVIGKFGKSPSSATRPLYTTTAPSAIAPLPSSLPQIVPTAPIATSSIPAIDLSKPRTSGGTHSSPPVVHTPGPRASASQKTVDSVTANCTPPFTIDADGNRHFKPECYPK